MLFPTPSLDSRFFRQPVQLNLALSQSFWFGRAITAAVQGWVGYGTWRYFLKLTELADSRYLVPLPAYRCAAESVFTVREKDGHEGHGRYESHFMSPVPCLLIAYRH